MGSEGRSKKKRRSSPSPTPSPDEDAKRRKHRKRESRRDDDDDGRSRKKKRSSRNSSEKHHKHSTSREGKERKPREKPKHRVKSEFKELSMDDYFSKNNEFSTWLKEEKGVYFSDLSSEQARDQFSSFVKQWNNQKLESRYYDGILSGPRTAHNWRIRT